MTSFSDIFKSSFLENVTSVSVVDMVIALLLAFGVVMFIFFVYKKTYSGVMYSSSFGGTLVALGYGQTDAAAVIAPMEDSLAVDELVRRALKTFMRG